MWAVCGLVVDGGKTKAGGLVVDCAWGEKEKEGAAGGGGAVDDEEKPNSDGCCCWVWFRAGSPKRGTPTYTPAGADDWKDALPPKVSPVDGPSARANISPGDGLRAKFAKAAPIACGWLPKPLLKVAVEALPKTLDVEAGGAMNGGPPKAKGVAGTAGAPAGGRGALASTPT
jgi:hypothetical protein